LVRDGSPLVKLRNSAFGACRAAHVISRRQEAVTGAGIR
jgi:hypothetical protein